jgi:TonB family protein
MSGSWRSEKAKMKNRWLIVVTVLISLLFHAGLGILYWKAGPLMGKAPAPEAMFVDMVSAPPGSVQDQINQGKLVTQQLPANEKRPKQTAIISHKDNRVEKETHRKDLPFNETSKNVGSVGKGGQKSGPGQKRPGKPAKQRTQPGLGQPGAVAKDLISSVGFGNLPEVAPGSSERGSGNVSPYNPKIGSPGNAININTKSFKYMSYFAGIKEKIEWAWVYPQQAQRSGRQGVLTMTFTILRNGRLKEARLVKSSGSRILDQAALEAVRDGADYPPMPATWDDEELTILANFEYRLIGTKSVF